MRMPFGRFRGVEIENLDDDYLDWLRSLGNLREPLRSAVEREWRARHADEPDTDEAAVAMLTPDVANVAAELVTAGFRALAKRYHPDVGGDAEAMRRLNEAVEALRGYIVRSTVAGVFG